MLPRRAPTVNLSSSHRTNPYIHLLICGEAKHLHTRAECRWQKTSWRMRPFRQKLCCDRQSISLRFNTFYMSIAFFLPLRFANMWVHVGLALIWFWCSANGIQFFDISSLWHPRCIALRRQGALGQDLCSQVAHRPSETGSRSAWSVECPGFVDILNFLFSQSLLMFYLLWANNTAFADCEKRSNISLTAWPDSECTCLDPEDRRVRCCSPLWHPFCALSNCRATNFSDFCPHFSQWNCSTGESLLFGAWIPFVSRSSHLSFQKAQSQVAYWTSGSIIFKAAEQPWHSASIPWTCWNVDHFKDESCGSGALGLFFTEAAVQQLQALGFSGPMPQDQRSWGGGCLQPSALADLGLASCGIPCHMKCKRRVLALLASRFRLW